MVTVTGRVVLHNSYNSVIPKLAKLLPQLDRSAPTRPPRPAPSRPPVISATKYCQYEKVGDDEAGDTPEQVKSHLNTCLCELHNLVEPEVAECQNEMKKS